MKYLNVYDRVQSHISFKLREKGEKMNGYSEAKAWNRFDLVGDALAALHKTTGIDAEVHANDREADEILLSIGGSLRRYDYVVYRRIDRFSTLLDLRARQKLTETSLLICAPLSGALAERCRELAIQFIDTAGNAYLNDSGGFFVFIAGRKAEPAAKSIGRDTALTPAALRLMFGALAEPVLLNAPYREISAVVGIATGAIARAFDTMETAGLIGSTSANTRLIRLPERMLSEWATGYLHRLRPQLPKHRFSAPDGIDIAQNWTPQYPESAWGGEQAAARVTGHLQPATATIYLQTLNAETVADLVRRFRLRADPNGPIEIVEAFWDMKRFAGNLPIVPLPLVYADLLETNDARNLAVANLIAPKVVAHVHDAQG